MALTNFQNSENFGNFSKSFENFPKNVTKKIS